MTFSTPRLSVLGALGAVSAALLVGLPASPAVADAPVYPAMNTSETPPDGVWFRNSPHTADTDQVTGHGVYMGESVQLQCYAFGDAVGQYNDSLWYYVTNVSRPTNNGVANVGYLNAHYINDGAVANQVDAGVPPCDGQSSVGSVSTPPASTPAPATPQPAPPLAAPTQAPAVPSTQSVFFSPNDTALGAPGAAEADQNIPLSSWASGHCSDAATAASVSGAPSVLAGWSKGRLGVVYYLASASQTQLAAVHRIVLFDPGNTIDFAPVTGWEGVFSSPPCDSQYDINSLLANWLGSDDSNRLIIISAESTEEPQGGVSTYAGLKQYYLANISGSSAASHAVVCDFNGMDHTQAYVQFSYIIKSSLFACPSANGLAQWTP